MAQQFAKLFEMPDGAQVLVQKLFDPEQDEYVLSTSTKLEHSHFDSRESYEDKSFRDGKFDIIDQALMEKWYNSVLKLHN